MPRYAAKPVKQLMFRNTLHKMVLLGGDRKRLVIIVEFIILNRSRGIIFRHVINVTSVIWRCVQERYRREIVLSFTTGQSWNSDIYFNEILHMVLKGINVSLWLRYGITGIRYTMRYF